MPSSPVPSRRALRVLRQLAFAGSAIAAVGLAGLNYHIYRRIRFLEQLRESKRQIRSFSAIHGRSQLAGRLEAAQNGQDFRLHVAHRPKPRPRRKTLVFESDLPGNLLVDEGFLLKVPPWSSSGPEESLLEVPIESGSVPSSGTHLDITSWGSKLQRKTDRTVDGLKLLSEGGRKKDNSTNAAVERIKKATLEMTTNRPGQTFGHRGVKKENSTDAAVDRIKIATLEMTTNRTGHTFGPRGRQGGELPSHLHKSLSSWLKGPETIAESLASTTAFGGDIEERAKAVGPSNIEPALELPNQVRSSKDAHEENMKVPMPLVTSASGAVAHSTPASSMPSVADAVKTRLVQSPGPENKTGTRLVNPETIEMMSKVRNQTAIPFPPASISLAAPSLVPDDLREGSIYFRPMESKSEEHLSSDMTDLELLDGMSTYPGDLEHEEALQFDTRPILKEASSAEIEEVDEEVRLWPINESEEEAVLTDNSVKSDTLTKEIQHNDQQDWTPFPRVVSTLPDLEHRSVLAEEDQIASSISLDDQTLRRVPEIKVALDPSVGAIFEDKYLSREESVLLAVDIRKAITFEGMHVGKEMLIAAMMHRLSQGDFMALDFLYSEFVDQDAITMRVRDPVFQTLISWHLEGNQNMERAAEMLFPNRNPKATESASRSSSGTVVMDQKRRDNAIAAHYLHTISRADVGSRQLVAGLREVVRAARFREVELLESTFAIVIWHLASSGDMEVAQRTYDEMVSNSGIEASLVTRSLLIRGYARMADWNQVENELEASHRLGLSRSQPHGYARMVTIVLKEYAARNSIDQVQTFLIKAISYWGLMPTSAVSTTAIEAFIAAKRYDLIREWIETLQVLFPQINTETNLFVYHVARTWKRLGSNCEEIEETVKALTYRNPESKFRTRSVSLLLEAVSQDLAVKNEALRARILPLSGTTMSAGDLNSPDPGVALEGLLSQSFSLAASGSSQDQSLASEKVELCRQANAAARLCEFFQEDASSKTVQQFCYPRIGSTSALVSNENSIKSGSSEVLHLKGSIPTMLTLEHLPDTRTVIGAVRTFYEQQLIEGLPTQYMLLPWVCKKLEATNRASDALLVLVKVYRHRPLYPIFAGREQPQRHDDDTSFSFNADSSSIASLPVEEGFQIDFYEAWMELAWSLNNVVQYRAVMAEVLRRSSVPPQFSPRHDRLSGDRQGPPSPSPSITPSTHPLKISQSFVYLARFVAERLRRSMGVRQGVIPKVLGLGETVEVSERREELGWLARMVERRRDEQAGRPEKYSRLNSQSDD